MIAVNMNSRILNPAPNAPADVVTVKPVSVAYLLGASDAEANISCTPEMFYVRRDSIQKYCEGYLSVNWTPMAVMVAEYYGCEVRS